MIRDDIKAAQIAAMKAGDKESRNAISLIQSAIKNRDIEERTKAQPTEDDTLVVEVLQKMVKQRRESIEMFRKGNREELAKAEEAEVAVIERFLPQQMSEAETAAAIEAIKAELGASGMKDMGRVMAELKARHASELDMSKASAAVKAALVVEYSIPLPPFVSSEVETRPSAPSKCLDFARHERGGGAESGMAFWVYILRCATAAITPAIPMISTAGSASIRLAAFAISRRVACRSQLAWAQDISSRIEALESQNSGSRRWSRAKKEGADRRRLENGLVFRSAAARAYLDFARAEFLSGGTVAEELARLTTDHQLRSLRAKSRSTARAMSLTPAFLDELRARTLLSALDRQDRQAHQGGPRVQGLLPVPQREDAVVLRQRRQGLLSLLRLLGAWRRDPLDDRAAGPAVHRCGQGSRPGGGHGNARAGPPVDRARRARQGASRGDGRRRRVLHRTAERHRRRGGARGAGEARRHREDRAGVRAGLFARHARAAARGAQGVRRPAADRDRAC